MKNYIIDLHIHSRFSRGCSKYLTPPLIAQWCEKKGIDIIATADFTHPGWINELKEHLEEAEEGLYKLKNSGNKTRFIHSTEISCIYKKHDKARRIHVNVLAPNFEIVEKINKKLGSDYNLKSDGRPILGLDAKELLKIILDIDERCMMIPSHIWTPWFALFGSKSGFNSIQECFEEMTPHIYAIETGLSSDPEMNWKLSQLNNIAILSHSDAHSVENLAREANVFQMETPSYNEITDIIKTNDPKRFLYTIEFYPQEGKYHYDGHRTCGISLTPQESKKYKNLCPKCSQPLTIGVLNRVEELADQQPDPKNRIPFRYLVPLKELLSEIMEQGVNTKKIKEEYDRLTTNIPEFEFLLHSPLEKITSLAGGKIAEGIHRIRKGSFYIKPGYDGVFGKVEIFKPHELSQKKQISLF